MLTLVLSFDSAVPRILLEVTGTDASLEIPDPNMFDGDIRLRRPGGDDWEPLESTVAKSQRGTGALDIAGPSGRTGRTGPPVRWPTTCST